LTGDLQLQSLVAHNFADGLLGLTHNSVDGDERVCAPANSMDLRNGLADGETRTCPQTLSSAARVKNKGALQRAWRRLANPHRYDLDAHRRPHHGLGRAITFGLILRAALLVVDNQQRAASNGLAFEFEFDWSLHD
jgi:hypothetical protein